MSRYPLGNGSNIPHFDEFVWLQTDSATSQSQAVNHTSRAAFQQLGGVVQIREVIVFIATCRYGLNIRISKKLESLSLPRKKLFPPWNTWKPLSLGPLIPCTSSWEKSRKSLSTSKAFKPVTELHRKLLLVVRHVGINTPAFHAVIGGSKQPHLFFENVMVWFHQPRL